MIKMYVMKTCPYCEYVERQVVDKPKFKVIDIGAHVRNLKEFLQLRDTRLEFAEGKAEGDVCVPCYVREDGSITLSSVEVGLEPMPDGYVEGVSCSLDGKGC